LRIENYICQGVAGFSILAIAEKTVVRDIRSCCVRAAYGSRVVCKDIVHNGHNGAAADAVRF
jgi:hypothetical protein